MKATIKDVADAAGVSTATVSRVLHNKPHVRPDLRNRVWQAIERLDYRPNLVARNLRSRQSSTIGLIVSDIRNAFFTAVSRAVEDVAYEQGMSVFLCNADEDPEKETLYLDVMRSEKVGGLIYSPTRHTAERLDEIDLDIPVVLIDRESTVVNLDTVLIDNEGSAYQLTEHLIAQGYRKIAALFGQASTTGRARRQGFERALQAHGLTAAAVRDVDAKMDTAYAAVKKLLQGGNSVDAIFTSNVMLTAGALRAIQECEWSIPEDVALVGYDDTIWHSLVQPAITVMAQPTDEIGRTATELLLKRIADPSRATRRVVLRPQLHARGSSAARRNGREG